jgi:mRNA interferase MazF
MRSGDVFWAELGPTLGTEQSGRRPVLVVSSDWYNRRSPRAVVCPVTGRARDWPFDLALPASMATQGYLLTDQIRTVHREDRLFEFIESAPEDFVSDVRGKLAALLGIAFAD